MNLLDVFKKNSTMNTEGILAKPGDKLEARITESNRKVVKVQKDGLKYSATQYPNGTIVETKVKKNT